MPTNKSLGQHWLKDRTILAAIADEVLISADDTVLEIGPGLGTLTSELLRRVGDVVAVEYDEALASKLPAQFPGKKLTVYNEDILQFDLTKLPKGYVCVANVPYYITSKIVDRLITSENPPSNAVLLVQKEVAERIAAKPGDMSMLALNAQVFAATRLGIEVPKRYFTPPPKVDSQVVVLEMRKKPLVGAGDRKLFFRIAKAGFANRRKKLRSSLSAGLAMKKNDIECLLDRAEVSSEARAQDLSIQQWIAIMEAYKAYE